ncbi:hypothetical protein QNA08_09590 [Chelatococcus sp. SYSU_G07232]|uniref:Uncharacterized protein n=1 Tax=Chelatococcus albus TaxID=3047466 RepID=A0ABT7AIR6_9HYPH|nr:hypothetical protein [Chelatococcus sp. SYSU_G07232]MDJ1158486.1 hypothetical protein [Chelatococcus sp. SYSU_G07232]
MRIVLIERRPAAAPERRVMHAMLKRIAGLLAMLALGVAMLSLVAPS